MEVDLKISRPDYNISKDAEFFLKLVPEIKEKFDLQDVLQGKKNLPEILKM